MALNETLKDELPKLFSLTAKLVQSCLRNYVDIQVQWHSTWQRKIKGILKEQQVPRDLAEIVEAFNKDFAGVDAELQSMSPSKQAHFSDGLSMISTTASTLVGTEEASLKRPSVGTSIPSYSSAPGYHMNNSPLIPEQGAGFDRRSTASSSTPALGQGFNSPRVSTDFNRLSSNVAGPVDPSSPQRLRLRAMSSSSGGRAGGSNVTPPLPPQRLSSTQTIAYGPYHETRPMLTTRPSTATTSRPQTATNTTSRNPAAIAARLSASSAKSITATPSPTSPGFPRTSGSTLHSMPSYYAGRQRSGPSTPDMNSMQPRRPSTSGIFNSAMPLSDAQGSSRAAAVNQARAPHQPSTVGGMAGLSRSVRPIGHDSGYATSSGTFDENHQLEHNRDREGDHVAQAQAQQQQQQQQHQQARAGQQEYTILFLAASLFEFNIDKSRKEAGYPYLTYVPGEVSLNALHFSRTMHDLFFPFLFFFLNPLRINDEDESAPETLNMEQWALIYVFIVLL